MAPPKPPERPTHKAHLVVWLDFSGGGKPTVTEVGVYGEAQPSTTSFLHRYPLEITHSRGSTYETAVENLRQYVRGIPHLRWSLLFFPKPR